MDEIVNLAYKRFDALLMRKDELAKSNDYFVASRQPMRLKSMRN